MSAVLKECVGCNGHWMPRVILKCALTLNDSGYFLSSKRALSSFLSAALAPSPFNWLSTKEELKGKADN